jgi:hypothetical protein
VHLIANLSIIEDGAEDIVLCRNTGRVAGVVTSSGNQIDAKAVVGLLNEHIYSVMFAFYVSNS